MSTSSTTLPRRAGPRTTIGPYEVVGRPLGRGGMGTVYRVQDDERRLFVVKELLPALVSDRNLARRFRQEFDILAGLSHPNLVRVMELFEANGTLNIRMEHLDAVSLKELLKARTRLPEAAAYAIGARVAAALAYVHEKGILHRDVKPDNILITVNGKVKLADFGVARAGRGTHTAAGAVVGTPTYLSPEQLGGRLDLGPPADLYSLGIMIYEMLEGRLPFPAGRRTGIVEMVQQRTAKPPRPFVATTDAQVRELIVRCLAPDPKTRPQCAREVHDHLAALDGPSPERAVAALVASQRPRPIRAPAPTDRSLPTTLGDIFNRGLSAMATVVVGAVVTYLLMGWPFGSSSAGDLAEWLWALVKALLARFKDPL